MCTVFEQVDIDGIRKQQIAAIDSVKSSVAVGLARGSEGEPAKRAAEASSSQERSSKKPKFYFLEDDGDEDQWSSDADDSCNNQGSVLHSVERNNDSRNSEETRLDAEDVRVGLRHQSGDSLQGGQGSMPEETSNGGTNAS